MLTTARRVPKLECATSMKTLPWRLLSGTLLEELNFMREQNPNVAYQRNQTPASVTVPPWFTVRAACKVAEAKCASDVTFYDQRGNRTTLSLVRLYSIASSRLLGNCIDPDDEPCATAVTI